MRFDNSETLLKKSFEDYSLSRGERDDLRKAIVDLDPSPHDLRFMRRRAFEIAREKTRDTSDFHILQWLEDVIKIIERSQKKITEEKHVETSDSIAAFSPGQGCRDEIISLIRNSRRSIDICVFTITDNRIYESLIEAHDLGVHIRLITDNDKAHDTGSDIYKIFRKNILVATDSGSDHMHHKFALFDRSALATGSFNWTRSASERNFENLIVIYEEYLVTRFSQEFDRLWGMLPRMQKIRGNPRC